MNMNQNKIKLTHRIFSAVLASLYLGLIIYSINCNVHCDTHSVSEGKHSHSQSGHHSDKDHGNKEKSGGLPVSGDLHLCKISQRGASQTIASFKSDIARVEIELHPLVEKSQSLSSNLNKSENPSRAPPVV